jgi:hypothetical protein
MAMAVALVVIVATVSFHQPVVVHADRVELANDG